MTDRDRCLAERAEAERLLLAGHPDIDGLVLAIADWSAELKLIEEEHELKASRN